MSPRVTAPSLRRMKNEGELIAALTAYDHPTAAILDAAGVDIILVGDSLGMVVLGYPDTIPVTMDDMVRHTSAVSRGSKRALVVADMPFMSYQASVKDAMKNAGRLLKEGRAAAVKLEGGGGHTVRIVERMVEAGIPVMGHVGLTPQSVNQFGGFKKQGLDEVSAERIRIEATRLQEAGAFAIVLESLPAELAAEITITASIPTIGIGAGPDCDGQILVLHDVIGLGDRPAPPFARRYAEVGATIGKAAESFIAEVRERRFP